MNVELELELEVRLEDVELEEEFTPRGDTQSSICSMSTNVSPSSSRTLVQFSAISGVINA